ncbi:hypothetical protein SDC9_163058 [bioreactor metagenome]|uniref:Uncharacterized protein n=1 Tax=bioreactor metagenome TaxID=1076179 RepID=A0A645FUP9_9ZZZZ
MFGGAVSDAAVFLLRVPVRAAAKAGVAQPAGVKKPTGERLAPALAGDLVVGGVADTVAGDVVQAAAPVAQHGDVHAAIDGDGER